MCLGQTELAAERAAERQRETEARQGRLYAAGMIYSCAIALVAAGMILTQGLGPALFGAGFMLIFAALAAFVP